MIPVDEAVHVMPSVMPFEVFAEPAAGTVAFDGLFGFVFVAAKIVADYHLAVGD